MATEKSPALLRLETFSDAVIAVAITVMVLDLRTPEIPALARSHRFDFSFLHQIAPKLVAYTVTFFLVATDWVVLVTRFRNASRATWPLLWLTLVHLFSVCLLPWAAALVSENPALPQAAAVYGACAVAVIATASLVIRHLEMIHPETGPWEFRKNMAVTALAGAASVAAFAAIRVALVLFMLLPLLYFMPYALQKRLFRSAFSPHQATEETGRPPESNPRAG